MPEDNGKQNPEKSYTNKYQKHIACSCAFKVKLLTNRGKLSLAKGIPVFGSASFSKLSKQKPKDPPD